MDGALKTHPLTAWRKANGKFAQQKLAELVGCSQAHLSEIENGNNKPSPQLTKRLHKVTGIPATELSPDLAELMGEAAQ